MAAAAGSAAGKRSRAAELQDESSKRGRFDGESSQIKSCIVYIVPNKLSSGHITHLKSVASKKQFILAKQDNESVTHVVTALPSYERVESVLNRSLQSCEVVTVQWLTDSFAKGEPLNVTDKYRLQNIIRPAVQQQPESVQEVSVQNYTYECQRPTLLEHPNAQISDALELLEKYYSHVDHQHGDTRALAFRKASCAIKVFPKKISSIEEVTNVHRIGKHSLRVIEDILSKGCSDEVEKVKKSEWFQCMDLFTSLYGCGSATADKWYNKGLRTIDDLKFRSDLVLTETQQLGLKYYEHLSQPIPRSETELIISCLSQLLKECCPGATVEAVGGFRRRKPFSHDVDLLLSHPDTEVANTLLKTVLQHLKLKGLLLHADMAVGQNTLAQIQEAHKHSGHPSYAPDGRKKRVKFDHLDKAFCILELASEQKPLPEQQTKEEGMKQTIIRRVDLIVSPPDQYPFALVSWTGSKQFNRSLRLYAVREHHLSVTAHGVYDMVMRQFIPAKTEREVFDILKLPYFEPKERNC